MHLCTWVSVGVVNNAWRYSLFLQPSSCHDDLWNTLLFINRKQTSPRLFGLHRHECIHHISTGLVGIAGFYISCFEAPKSPLLGADEVVIWSWVRSDDPAVTGNPSHVKSLVWLFGRFLFRVNPTLPINTAHNQIFCTVCRTKVVC